MLTGCNPNPEGPSEVCDLAPRAGGRQAVGVVGRLHGWTALGFSLHLLTAGPWPGLQSLGFFIWEGPVFYREMRSQVCVIKNPRTHTQQVPPGARHSGSYVLSLLPLHLSAHPLHPLPSVQEVLPVIQSGSGKIPRPATALLLCSLAP